MSDDRNPNTNEEPIGRESPDEVVGIGEDDVDEDEFDEADELDEDDDQLEEE